MYFAQFGPGGGRVQFLVKPLLAYSDNMKKHEDLLSIDDYRHIKLPGKFRHCEARLAILVYWHALVFTLFCQWLCDLLPKTGGQMLSGYCCKAAASADGLTYYFSYLCAGDLTRMRASPLHPIT